MIDLGQKVSLESFQLLWVVFSQLEQKYDYFQKVQSLVKEWRATEKFSDNLVSDITFWNFSTF